MSVSVDTNLDSIHGGTALSDQSPALWRPEIVQVSGVLSPVKVRLRDARGTEVDFTAWRLTRSSWDADTERVIGRATSMMTPPLRRQLFVSLAAVGVMIGVLVFTFMPVIRLLGSIAGFFVGALNALVITAITQEVRRRHIRRVAGEAAAYVLSEGYCPTCAYTLRGLAPEDGLNLRCPECSSAWPIASVRRREADAAPAPEGGSVTQPMRAALLRPWQQLAKRSTDDRGKPVILVRSRLSRERLAEPSDDARARMAAASRAMRRPGLPARALLLGLAGLVIMPAAYFALRRMYFSASLGSIISVLNFAMMLFFMVFWGIPIMLSDIGVRASRLKRELLKRSLCPSCAQELQGIAEADDGRVECPRCNAAWLKRGESGDENTVVPR